MIDWQATALAAARANAAYLIDQAASQAAFAALGDTWIAQYKNASHQAVLSADAAGETRLSISGTRASAFKVMDVLADMSLDPVPVAGGHVTAGVQEGMQALWDWVLQVVPRGDVVHVAGHSLGGARTHLTPLFLPVAQIGALHSFEAPKFADSAFYAAHADPLANMVCVVDGADLWASWPWKEGPLKDLRWQARPLPAHVWLKDDLGTFEMIPGAQWPEGDNPADHDIARVQARIEKIAAASSEPEAA
ncbi:hypothetical protein [Trinickia dinghuensis]|uniref:Lipase n=1 Tax=Trinickia dinghuensis TaxID=2291023 RepID=A0A3D8K1B2_9BURK|nr:hypothetical protein [Trinickia dinghuensis]RDU99247.1 hypothetical protein DWV00_08995 [Trinickia dinghuensis]